MVFIMLIKSRQKHKEEQLGTSVTQSEGACFPETTGLCFVVIISFCSLQIN